MSADLYLSDIRARWNEVLDVLEKTDRIAWLAYFDARLESFDNGRLTLDFSDAGKLAAGHDYQGARLRLRSLLQSTIRDVLGASVIVVEK